MNITCYLSGGKLYVVDCGLRFTDPTKLGTDAVIPSVDFWFEQAGGVYAYLITHAHEDHIGAMPFIVTRWPAPIYTTRWTAEVLRTKFSKRGLDPSHHPMTIVHPGDHVTGPGFDAEWVHVNHSIPDACALFIKTPSGHIFHTGDFKFDRSPVLEPPMSDEHLTLIASKGVDLLLADSTNADKSGYSPSEASVYQPLLNAFKTCTGAIVLATFASNFWRLKTIVDVCLATKRRLFITGPGIEQSFEIADRLGIYSLPPDLRVTDENIDEIPRENLVVLATGCQGEFRSALNRIAYGEHRQFQIRDGDTVILSSRIIPGNERPILSMVDQLKRRGANVITTRHDEGIHVSGHAYRGDLERLFSLLKPRCYTPIHGAYSQLDANRKVAETSPPTHACLIENGDIITLKSGEVSIEGRISIDLEYVDSESGTVLSYETLRERLRIGELGAAIVTGVYNVDDQVWYSPPEIELIGLRLPNNIEQNNWLSHQSEMLKQIVQDNIDKNVISNEVLIECLRIAIRRSLLSILRKKPVVFVKIHFLRSST